MQMVIRCLRSCLGSCQLCASSESCTSPVGPRHHTEFLKEGGNGFCRVCPCTGSCCMRDMLQGVHGAIVPVSCRLHHHRQKANAMLLANVACLQVCNLVLGIGCRRRSGCLTSQSQSLLPRVRCDSEIQCSRGPGQGRDENVRRAATAAAEVIGTLRQQKMGSFLFRTKTSLHGPLAHQIADSMMPPRAFTTGNAGGSMIAVPVQDAIAARTPGVCISVRHQQPEAELRTKSCRFHTSGAVGNCCKESPAPNRSFRMKDGLFDRGCLAQLVGPASRINTMGQIALLGGKGGLNAQSLVWRQVGIEVGQGGRHGRAAFLLIGRKSRIQFGTSS